MRCERCNGSKFVRDEHTGNSYCGGCGTLQEYDNYEAQVGGITGPQGRRPMPLIVAVLAFVTQVNGLKIKIEDLAKDALVSLTTCKTRYKELLERLVKVAQEVSLPWGKDVTMKNVVKHAGALIGIMEAKSMRKRKEEAEDELVSGGICLKDIVRDCLSKDTSMYCDDGQKTMSKYFDVGGESQATLSLSNTNDNTSVNQLSKTYKEIVDRVRGETHETRNLENSYKTVEKTGFEMVLGEDWWKGKSELSQKLLFKEVLGKDVGFDAALPPSYIKGCNAVKRRKEKIKAAKLRIKMIQEPFDFVSEVEVSSEPVHSNKRRKIGSAIDWEDMVIQTLILHDVNDDEIEKGHYKTLLDLHVFNSGDM